MEMAKTDPCSCNAWRTCGTKSIASTERCSQSDRNALQSHPSVSVAFAFLSTTCPSVAATQESRIALKAIRFQESIRQETDLQINKKGIQSEEDWPIKARS